MFLVLLISIVKLSSLRIKTMKMIIGLCRMFLVPLIFIIQFASYLTMVMKMMIARLSREEHGYDG